MVVRWLSVDESAEYLGLVRRGVSMARPKKAAKPEAASTAEENGTSTDEAFTKGAVKIRCRPRVTHHGCTMKTAVGGH
jgi:hypothetical protein